MAAACELSIVISTFNRRAGLVRAVEACLAQDGDVQYEVLVVDNNSTDDTRAWVEDRARSAGGRLRYLFEPRQGLPYARNTGVQHARADIVAFTDDDVEVAADWAVATVRAFAIHPEVDIIGGKVLPRWPGPAPRWFSRLQWAPLALQDKGDAPVAIDASNAAPCLIGASFAFRREVFDRIGLFDAAYLRAQDREIQLRLWQARGRGLYVPDVVAWVDVPPERLTRAYFRFWYSRSGRYASRMRLLERIDAEGRLVEPARRSGRSILGCPAFVLRQILEHGRDWMAALIRRDEALAFYNENRVRFLWSYARERMGEGRRKQDRPASAPAGMIRNP